MLRCRPAGISRTTAGSSRSTARRSRRAAYLPATETQSASRRHLLQSIALGAPLTWHSLATAAEGQRPPPATNTSAERCWLQLSKLPRGVCYAQAGPLQPLELPHLEHICTSCFPACVGDKCILNINVTYPKGGSLLGMSPPYPLAVFSGGFTVNSAAYRSTAARLASWGYTVVRYDTRDALPDVLDDVTCVRLQRELIDWAATHPLMRRLADTRRVYLAGHSRGGKLAALTAAADSRVAALCLLDPVDVTQYAPLSDRFPSAAAALSAVAHTGRFVPVAVVGSGKSGDCAPRFNNYESFFQASPSAAWQVLLPAAGHFQYLDQSTALQRAVCGGTAGVPDDEAVRHISQAALVAWGETMLKLPGTDVLSCLAARCSGLGTTWASITIDASSSGSSSWSVGGSGFGSTADRSSSSNPDPGVSWSPLSAGVPLRALLQQRQAIPAANAAAATSQMTASQWQPPSATSAASAAALTTTRTTTSTAQHSADMTQQQIYGLVNSEPDVQQLGGARPLQTANSTASPEAAMQLQQQQQQLSASPMMQTRQEIWRSSMAPSPAQLRSLKVDLERLLVAVMYQSSATLDVRTRFKNFGS